MINKLCILCLLLFTFNVNAQVINYVDKKYNADVNVFFVTYKYEADIIVYRTKYKHDAKIYPGKWYWREDGGNEYDTDRINVHVVKYKSQADYIVYISEYSHEIKVTFKYLEEWIK